MWSQLDDHFLTMAAPACASQRPDGHTPSAALKSIDSGGRLTPEAKNSVCRADLLDFVVANFHDIACSYMS